MFGYHFNYSLPFLDGATKRNHDLDVSQPHVASHSQQRRAFEREAVGIADIVISRSSSKSEHRVLFLRLKLIASQETSILIRFEVTGANNDRLRIERRRYSSYAFAETTDEKLAWIFIGNTSCNLFCRVLILQVGVTRQGHRVNADVVGYDELSARQTNAGIGNER